MPSRMARASAADEDWIQLFNGRDLTGWTPKLTHHELGDNFANTFRVEDGLLKVRYDKWTGWNGEFGHIFYKDAFSYYLLAAEYRFVGEQVPLAIDELPLVALLAGDPTASVIAFSTGPTDGGMLPCRRAYRRQ